MGTSGRFRLGLLGLAAIIGGSCAAPTTSTTRIDITTVRTICGGAVPPPGVPACRTSPASRTVEVSKGRAVVASGTSGSDGELVVEVPPGELVVSVPGALPYEGCEPAAVTAVAGHVTAVAQTCTMLVP